ncbi:hypothetical protein DD592_25845 [Enterobacter cloacae complex sp. 2DZ2F20B]|nr:hypothetical protein DD592_25845 [Enterobacter cloacae complex sp. 2DZ2F20B]
MTLDKFGRHLLKHAKLSGSIDNDMITISNYMFYNLIFRFESDKTVENTYVLNSKETHYTFPLEIGTLTKLNITINEINVYVNNKFFSKEELKGFVLRNGDRISFKYAVNKTENVPNLFAEMIIKCPVNFEESLVSAEKAHYIHKTDKNETQEGV